MRAGAGRTGNRKEQSFVIASAAIATGFLTVDLTWLFAYRNQQETYFLLGLCVGKAKRINGG
jgi:hypothetical protein